MPEVRWSRAIRIHTPDSRLGDFLDDVKWLPGAPADAEPTYMPVRVSEDDWYLLEASTAVALLPTLGSYYAEAQFHGNVSEVAWLLKGICVPAFVLAPGRSRTVELSPLSQTRGCYAIELDSRGNPMRVGALATLAPS